MMKKTKHCIIFFAVLLFAFSGCAEKEGRRNPYNLDITNTPEKYRKEIASNPDMELVDLGKIKNIYLDIRYATKNNFTKEIIYTSPRAFARKPVYEALQKVQDSLAHYNISLKIFDAYRPYAASLKFFEVYPDTNFVANPRTGSRHNRGCAIDLTLAELSTGKELPMQTEFDDFTEKANPKYDLLPDTVKANRKILFDVMKHFGLNYHPSEWWHFDFNGWQNYKLMDLSFEELDRIK